MAMETLETIGSLIFDGEHLKRMLLIGFVMAEGNALTAQS